VVLADLLRGALTRDGVLAGKMVQAFNQFPLFYCGHWKEVTGDETTSTGVIAGECMKRRLVRVTDMVEKPCTRRPHPATMAIIGRYIPDTGYFRHSGAQRRLVKNVRMQILTPCWRQAKTGLRNCLQISKAAFCCGSINGVVEATKLCLRKTSIKKLIA